MSAVDSKEPLKMTRGRTIQLADLPSTIDDTDVERGRSAVREQRRPKRRQSSVSLRGQVDGTHRVVGEFRSVLLWLAFRHERYLTRPDLLQDSLDPSS